MNPEALRLAANADQPGARLRRLAWLRQWWRSATPIPQSATEDLLLYRAVTENVSDVIVRLNSERRRSYVSPSCHEVLGYTQQEMLGGGAFDLVHPDDRPDVLALFDTFGSEQPLREATWRMQRKDGNYIWVEARYRYLDGDGGLVVILRDVHRRKMAEEQLADAMKRLERLAMQDGLTGLPNRRHFLEALAKRLEAHDSIAVLFIDLDNFKPVNDLYGHDFGDTILVAIANRLANALDQDAVVGRLGGDEFAVLLGAHGGDAPIAERAGTIVEAISMPITEGGVTVSVGASIGIALSPRDGSDVSGMLRAADIAMYHAKRTAGGRFQFFAPWMHAGSADVTQRQRALRHHQGGGEQTNRMSYIT